MPLNLNPDNAVRGGLLDNIEARIADAQYKSFVYVPKDTSRPSVTAMVLELTLEYEDAGSLVRTDEQTSPKYSCGGRLEDWSVSPDGYILTGPDNFNDNSNIIWLMKELVNAGFPKETLVDTDARRFIDLVAYWKQKVQPDRPGLANQTRTDDSGVARARTTLMPAEVRRLPGQKASTGGVQARGATRAAPRAQTTRATAPIAQPASQVAAAAASSAVSNGNSPDFAEKAGQLVVEILADGSRGDDAGAPMALADLKMAALRRASAAGLDVKALIGALASPESTVALVGDTISATTVDRQGKSVPAVGIV